MQSPETNPGQLQNPSPARRAPDSWRPFLREADLIRMCFATGLYSLVRANHKEQGLYIQAFFNLSVGLERLLKLVYVIDFALTHSGEYPPESTLRKDLGHDLRRLFESGIQIRERLDSDGHIFKFNLVDEELAQLIVGVFHEFAQSSGRYSNFNQLVGASKDHDPIEAWMTDVAGYLQGSCPENRKKKDMVDASMMTELVDKTWTSTETTEAGQLLGTATNAFLQSRLGEWVQGEATFHCATIIRFFVEVLGALNGRAHLTGTIELPYFLDFFAIFLNDDQYLKGRKTFLS